MLLNYGVLEKTFESPLGCRRSNQSILKEISPEYSLEGLMLKPKLQYFGHPMWRVDSLEKTLLYASPSRSRRERRPRGRRRPRPWPWWRSRRPRRWSTPCSRRGPRILAMDRTSNPRGTSPALSNGPATSGCSGKGLFSISCWKCLLQLSNSPRPWTNKQLLNCLNWPPSTDQRQSKRRSRGCWPELRRKPPAKATSPPRGHLSLEQRSTLSPPWWRTRRLSWWRSLTMWIPSSSWSSCLPCAARWGFPTASSRARPGWGAWSTGRHAPL